MYSAARAGCAVGIARRNDRTLGCRVVPAVIKDRRSPAGLNFVPGAPAAFRAGGIRRVLRRWRTRSLLPRSPYGEGRARQQCRRKSRAAGAGAHVPSHFQSIWRLTLGLSLQQKQDMVAEVSEQVASAQTVVIAEYRNLTVSDMTDLRRSARGAGVYLRVVKNTLARRAVADTPFHGLAEQMVGPLAYGISTDPVAAAKVLSDYAKANDKLVIKGGAMANKVMSAKEVVTLASMPSRE